MGREAQSKAPKQLRARAGGTTIGVQRTNSEASSLVEGALWVRP